MSDPRYTFVREHGLVEVDNGDWVKYEAYAELEKQVAETACPLGPNMPSEICSAGTCPACLRMHLKYAREEITKIMARLESSEISNKAWHQLVENDSENEELARKAAGKWDTSDSYGVQPLANIIEKMKAAIDRMNLSSLARNARIEHLQNEIARMKPLYMAAIIHKEEQCFRCFCFACDVLTEEDRSITTDSSEENISLREEIKRLRELYEQSTTTSKKD